MAGRHHEEGSLLQHLQLNPVNKGELQTNLTLEVQSMFLEREL